MLGNHVCNSAESISTCFGPKSTVYFRSSIEVEVTFCPHTEKVYNFNLPCVVRTKPTPINLNIKGEGYSVHDVLMLLG